MQIEIRTYRHDDRAGCRSLWAELVERHRLIYQDPTIGGEDPGLEFDDHLVRAGEDHVWLAVVDGSVVGLTALLLAGGESEVERVMVTSSVRSSGIGALLVAQARAEAVSLGVRFLNVSPVARNIEAISFFVREGFVNVGHINLFEDLSGEVPRSWRPGLVIHGNRLSF